MKRVKLVEQMNIGLKEKTIGDLIKYLSGKFEVVKIQENDAGYERRKQLFVHNILHSLKNQVYGYSENELDIVMYEIRNLPDEQRALFQPKNPGDVFDYSLNPIYVLFEFKTRSIETNSQLLQEDLVLELGVNKFEFDNNIYQLYYRILTGEFKH